MPLGGFIGMGFLRGREYRHYPGSIHRSNGNTGAFAVSKTMQSKPLHDALHSAALHDA
jgi:hypothetical protein